MWSRAQLAASKSVSVICEITSGPLKYRGNGPQRGRFKFAHQLFSDADDVESLDHTPPAGISKLRREFAVLKQALDEVRQSDRVGRWRQQPRSRNHQFSGPPGRRGHNRYA